MLASVIRCCRAILIGAVVAGFASVASAGAAPTAAAATPVALDQPYPGGTLTLNVDLTSAGKRIYRVHETIPVASSGPLTLYYPQWIPGEHAPTGPINNIAGLIIRADGEKLAWRRDLRDMYALHLDVPTGATQLKLQFQFLSPGRGGAFGASVSATPALVDLEFNQVAFYPAGYYTRRIPIQATVALPRGWQFATALEVASRAGNTITFKPVSFNVLVDSPLIAGRHFKRVVLDPGADVPVALNIVADAADDLAISKEQIAKHRELVDQVYALFGARHYAHYDFLLTLSDHTGHFGLEHHQSSDDRLWPDFFTDDSSCMRLATLMPHEFVHSWNGKFRRPAKLWTPTFNTVKQDNLLWVYEGLTDYWAGVLTTRAGLWTKAQYHDAIASIASAMAHRSGRAWRPLRDTADAARLTYSGGHGWINWRRGTDFYPEGQLLWLDVDTKIRALSDGKHSLDDFARAFFGMNNGSKVTKTYSFDDLVAALNSVRPFDWATFLHVRLNYTGDELPEHGLKRGGWNVVYSGTPSAYDKATATLTHGLNLARSIGLVLSGDGDIRDVQWSGPAFKAGLVPGMSVIAVNGRDYDGDTLKRAISAAADDQAPIDLLVKNHDYFSHARIHWHGGLRYPHLERIKGTPNRLDAILAPRQAPPTPRTSP